MKDKYPDIFSSLSAVPGMAGSSARTSFLSAFDSLTAVFGGAGGAEEIFLVAVVVWIFLSTKSTKSAYLNLVLKFYLWLPTSALPRLRAAMGNTANWVSLLSASDSWSTFDVYTSAGYERLDPSRVGSSESAAMACAQSWHDLFSILLSAITSSAGGPELGTLRLRLKPNHPEHAQGPAESIVEYIARLQMDYDQVSDDLRALNKSTEIPHPDACLVDMAFAGCKPAVLTQFNRLFRENNLTDTDMTWYLVREYLVRAGCNTETILLRTKRPEEPKRGTKPELKPDTKVDAKKVRPDKPKSEKPSSSPSTYQGTPPPPNVAAMSVSDRIAKARENRLCSNCHGKHKAHQCPHARVDGQPWHDGHQFGDTPTKAIGAPAVMIPSMEPTADPTPAATLSDAPPAVARPGIAQSFKAMGFNEPKMAVGFSGVVHSRKRVREYHTDSDGNRFRTGGSSGWSQGTDSSSSHNGSSTTSEIDSMLCDPFTPIRDPMAAEPLSDTTRRLEGEVYTGTTPSHSAPNTSSPAMNCLALHMDTPIAPFPDPVSPCSRTTRSVCPDFSPTSPIEHIAPIRVSALSSIRLWFLTLLCAMLTRVGNFLLRTSEFCIHVSRFFTYVPPAPCTRSGCPCASFDGNVGKFCCLTCRDGQACQKAFHQGPMIAPPRCRILHLDPCSSDAYVTFDPAWPHLRKPHWTAWVAIKLDALVLCLLPVLGCVLTPLSWINSAIPRIRQHQRVLISLLLLMLISWLTLPADAIPTHHADGDQFYPTHRPNPDQQPRGKACPGAGASGNVGVFNSFLPSGARVTVGPDSFCDVSMIAPHRVDPAWASQKVPHPIWLDGIGGHTALDTIVEVPLQLQWNAPIDTLFMYVGPTPPEVDIILGRDAMNDLGGIIDCGSSRFFSKAHQLDIPMDSIASNQSRVTSNPITIMATSSGCSLAYCTFRNLGFTVKHWYAVDSDELCRNVAASIVPTSILTHIAPHDVTQLPNWVNNLHVDFHLDTSPCQPFSRARRNPPGFGDKLRTAPARHAAALYNRLRKVNPSIHHLVENVQFHHALQSDKTKFEEMWSSTFVPLNASDYGSPSSRPRQYLANFTDLSKLPTRPSLPPHLVMDHGHHPQSAVMPCVVATADTHNPPCSYPPKSKTLFPVSVEVMERLQGWPTNITAIAPDLSSRQRLIGNALNASQLWSILRSYSVHQNSSTSMAYAALGADVLPATASQLQQQLGALSDKELADWVRRRKGSHEPIPFSLEPISGQMPPARPRFNYSIPSGLRRSCDYAIDMEISKGHMRSLEKHEITHDMFVSPGFVQPKEGRFYEDTDIQMVRLLADSRYLNAAMKPPAAHHLISCPTQWDMCIRVPTTARFFRAYDIADAFHSCKVAEHCLKYTVVQFGDRFVQYTGGQQGISNLAVFWNVHFQDILDRQLGLHWRDWYTIYVDDVGVHGATPEEVMIRSRIFEAILHAYGKTVNSKNSDSPYDDHMILAGLHFDKSGVSLSEKAILSLHDALDAYTVKSLTDVQHVVGVIQYASSAFSWPDALPSPEFTDIVSGINAIGSAPHKTIKELWTREFPPLHNRLKSLLHNIPRLALDPATMVSNESCLIQVSDASDTGVAVSLFRVLIADASTVTKEHLLDRTKSQLIAVRYRKLTGAQTRWHTFEAELYAMVLGVKFFGSFITTATANYPADGIPKIAFWSDSTTALSQWNSLTLPAATTDFLSAKARRFYAWADEVSFSKYWPLHLKHIPGDTNDLAHVMSHLGDQMKSRHEIIEAANAKPYLGTPSVAFMAVHSYHQPTLSDPTSNYSIVHLPLSTQQIHTIAEAYLSDDTLVAKVPLSDIYRMITNHPTSVSICAMHKQSIRGWVNTRFFSVVPPGAGNQALLYTASSATRTHDCDAPESDGTRILVPVIPRGADVRITKNPPITDAGDGRHYMDHDLRNDILLHVHDNAHHCNIQRTQDNLRSIAWWPNSRMDVDTHVKTCTYCTAALTSHTPVGDSVHAKHRFRLIEIDHKILDASTAAATGCAAILTMLDDVSKLTLFIPVPTTSARDAAHAILVHWYPLFGAPLMFRSDKGAAFTSSLMKQFADLLGVEGWDLSAPDNPTHHSGVERRNRVMEHYLDVGASSGDLLNFTALERYCAAATATCNLEYSYNGHTVMEYVTGAKPRIRNDIVIKPVIDDVPLTELDATFLTSLQSVLSARLHAVQLLRDDTARDNALRKSATVARQCTTSFDLRPGDTISYDGKRHKLIKHTRSTPTAPMRSLIQSLDDPSAKPFEVRYSTLRPVGTHRSQHMLSHDPDEASYTVGDFVFYTHPTSLMVNAGVITGIDGPRCLVHEHRQAPRRNRQFTPLYFDDDTKTYLTKNKTITSVRTCDRRSQLLRYHGIWIDQRFEFHRRFLARPSNLSRRYPRDPRQHRLPRDPRQHRHRLRHLQSPQPETSNLHAKYLNCKRASTCPPNCPPNPPNQAIGGL